MPPHRLCLCNQVSSKFSSKIKRGSDPLYWIVVCFSEDQTHMIIIVRENLYIMSIHEYRALKIYKSLQERIYKQWWGFLEDFFSLRKSDERAIETRDGEL